MQSSSIFYLETSKIKPNPLQPRREFDQTSLEELANSIKEYGILEPLIVTRSEKETQVGRDVEYQLLAGERRLMAAKIAGLSTVPTIIKDNIEDQEKLEIALVENIQREDLNPIEKAKGFANLMDKFGLSQREVAFRVGKSREAVANALRLLQLPSEIQRALEEKKITEGHARIILSLPGSDKQRMLLGRILSYNLTVRQTEITAKELIRETSFSSPTNEFVFGAELELKEIENKLEETLNTKVMLRKKGAKGVIAINFSTQEELENIIRTITQNSELKTQNFEEKDKPGQTQPFIV
ncbi:MAG: hypothetical protein A2418_01505 [Candidatus Brennerbacteria bacterium RIFOXYC1_FULL_41_11]|uniref:ParB-like N-terminal domain-containing protein n=1 Tax=Candidatus Brennerbacteria bacterium RIFOXYD1_FULL_41_16 TaxID=1797529 RepID=A0A1G1XK55_9BACT|nr:MAG: hypothetical protein A2418_01505 [Candidatus Brennerbacteria bacterium RIFOXYC1_FULL_41_11]OGY40525.1 MAG: hypothetical protein A2570_02165 [Candidatus Brennerbacteria bacterium RIFOXYD1_FULL_41_16]